MLQYGMVDFLFLESYGQIGQMLSPTTEWLMKLSSLIDMYYLWKIRDGSDFSPKSTLTLYFIGTLLNLSEGSI